MKIMKQYEINPHKLYLRGNVFCVNTYIHTIHIFCIVELIDRINRLILNKLLNKPSLQYLKNRSALLSMKSFNLTTTEIDAIFKKAIIKYQNNSKFILESSRRSDYLLN